MQIPVVGVSPRELLGAVREEGFEPGPAKLRMAVKGLRCASCVSQVEGALQRTPGVVFEDGRSLGGYHNITHHGKDEQKLKELREIETDGP